MADAPETAKPAKGGKGSMMVIAMIAGVAIFEAVGFFVFLKFFYATPQPTYGQEAGAHVVEPEPPAHVEMVEIKVFDKFRIPNNARGVPMIYVLDLAITVPMDKQEHAAALVEGNAAQIRDRVSQLVRAASERVMDEVDFRTLRVQIREALIEIFRDEHLVDGVFIPQCVPMRAG